MTAKGSRRRELVEESLELALVRDPDFPRLFYEILFREHPDAEAENCTCVGEHGSCGTAPIEPGTDADQLSADVLHAGRDRTRP